MVALLGAIGLPWRRSILVGEVVDYCLIIKTPGKRIHSMLGGRGGGGGRKRKEEWRVKEENRARLGRGRGEEGQENSLSLGEETSIKTSTEDYEDEGDSQTARHGKQNQRKHATGGEGDELQPCTKKTRQTHYPSVQKSSRTCR